MELLERDEALAELHRQFERSATHGRVAVVPPRRPRAIVADYHAGSGLEPPVSVKLAAGRKPG